MTFGGVVFCSFFVNTFPIYGNDFTLDTAFRFGLFVDHLEKES